MKIINYFFTIIIAVITMIMSLFFVITCWWFLLLPKYKRFWLFDTIIVTPWTFVFNHILLGMRLKVIGKENIDKKRASLYICNHQSWADIPLVNKYSHTIAVSKTEVLMLPLIGLLILYSGPIFVNRNDRVSRLGIVKKLMKVLKMGMSIVLFPEGTRTKDGSLLTPNNAAIRLCYKINIPVVSAAIEGTRDILPRGRFYFKFFQKVVLIYNKPIYPADYENEDDFTEACWNKVVSTHDQILKDYFPEKLKK